MYGHQCHMEQEKAQRTESYGKLCIYSVTQRLWDFLKKKLWPNFSTAALKTREAVLECQHLEGISDEKNLGSTPTLLEVENLSRLCHM